MEIAYEMGLIFALILANGVFSMSEMAIVSIRKARLQKRAQSGNEGARVALALANSPASFLSTVQVGITLIGVLAGAFGGARLAAILGEALMTSGMEKERAESVAFTLVIAAITFFSLVIGELVPKRLSLAFGESIACWISRPMALLSRLAFPVVKTLDLASDAVVWLMRIRTPAEAPPSEDEIRVMVGQAATAGVIEQAEHDMVHRALSFSDRGVTATMTPAIDVVFLSADEPAESVREKIGRTGHSHYPVCADGLDDVVGVMAVKFLVSRPSFQRLDELKDAFVPALFVPASMNNTMLLELFKASRKHMAFVVDEFGRVTGLVTLIDLMESLVGEMPLDADGGEAQITRRDDGSWLLDGLTPVEVVKAKFKLDAVPNEGKGLFQTVGGMVLMQFGRIPKAGDHFAWAGHRFEVVDMDGNRVDKVLVTPMG